MHWVYLILSIIFEVFGTTSMKLSEGFTKLLPSVMIFVFYSISFFFFALALRKIDLSIAYAIWAGLGTALVALIGIFVFKEPITVLKITSLLLVILGVIGLRMSGVE